MKAKRIPRERRKRTPEDIRFDRCLGKIIREAREERSISLQAAAKAVKVSRQPMERIEAGATTYVTDLYCLSRCLDVPPAELISRADERMNEDESRG